MIVKRILLLLAFEVTAIWSLCWLKFDSRLLGVCVFVSGFLGWYVFTYNIWYVLNGYHPRTEDAFASVEAIGHDVPVEYYL